MSRFFKPAEAPASTVRAMQVHTPEAGTLEQVMRKTEGILAGVRPDQLDLPTPCTEWDVRQLENHMVGWSRHFAARESGAAPEGDPSAYQVSGDAAREFDSAVQPLVTALDRKISAPADPEAGGFPPTALATMLTGEYVIHGWDLATATGQPVPYTDAEAEAALAMKSLLTPENRGQMFGPEVPVPPGATPLQQLIAYSGRRPL